MDLIGRLGLACSFLSCLVSSRLVLPRTLSETHQHHQADTRSALFLNTSRVRQPWFFTFHSFQSTDHVSFSEDSSCRVMRLSPVLHLGTLRDKKKTVTLAMFKRSYTLFYCFSCFEITIEDGIFCSRIDSAVIRSGCKRSRSQEWPSYPRQRFDGQGGN